LIIFNCALQQNFDHECKPTHWEEGHLSVWSAKFCHQLKLHLVLKENKGLSIHTFHNFFTYVAIMLTFFVFSRACMVWLANQSFNQGNIFKTNHIAENACVIARVLQTRHQANIFNLSQRWPTVLDSRATLKTNKALFGPV